MKWYIAQMRPEQYKQIIDSHEHILTDYGENQIAFPESELDSILALCSIKEFTEEKTSEENVYLIKPTRHKVHIQNVEYAEKLRKTLEIYSGVFDIDIDFRVPHGKGAEAVFDDTLLHIFVYSFPLTANNNYEATRYGMLFDYSLPNETRDGFSSKNCGISISDKNGVICAEVFPRNIFILFDLTHNADTYGLYLIPLAKIILDQAIPLALKPGDKFVEELKKITEQKRRETIEKNKNAYIAACKKRIEIECQNIQKTISATDAQLRAMSTNFIELSRGQETLIMRLNMLTKRQTQEEERFIEEYKKLFEMPYVESVDVSENRIIVSTDCISIRYDDHVYAIGKFTIDIEINSGLTIKNTTRRLSIDDYYYDHPHIRGGSPCLGNIGDSITKLISRYEFSLVIQLLVQFLETYNPENPYKAISYWK
ncbi:MAG: hypothetical protein HYW78_04405 [Parcubacteria group bacterium]|nr:hypothetical protein [Parcubacteria group bacterium]